MGHAIVEPVFLFGTRSADYIRASGHSGCIAMEVTLRAKTGRIHDRTRTLRRKVRFPLAPRAPSIHDPSRHFGTVICRSAKGVFRRTGAIEYGRRLSDVDSHPPRPCRDYARGKGGSKAALSAHRQMRGPLRCVRNQNNGRKRLTQERPKPLCADACAVSLECVARIPTRAGSEKVVSLTWVWCLVIRDDDPKPTWQHRR
jgi:hypothetical protein